MDINISDGEAYFRQQLQLFECGLGLATRISQSTHGIYVKTRFGWASYLFSRLAIVAISVSRLTEDFSARRRPYRLDHTSVMSLSRNIIEATLMFSYLSQSVIDDETWEFRRDVLWLHDATTRYKMFKAWKNDQQASGHKKNRDDLLSKVASCRLFKQLDALEQAKVAAGAQMYIGGLRGAARSAGWEPSHFEGVYTYLSQHSHSGPLSFIRTEEHEVNYLEPSDAQFALAGFAIEHARQAIEVAARRMVELFPDSVTDHGFENLQEEPESPYARWP